MSVGVIVGPVGDGEVVGVGVALLVGAGVVVGGTVGVLVIAGLFVGVGAV